MEQNERASSGAMAKEARLKDQHFFSRLEETRRFGDEGQGRTRCRNQAVKENIALAPRPKGDRRAGAGSEA
jgi:hypothetical protein